MGRTSEGQGMESLMQARMASGTDNIFAGISGNLFGNAGPRLVSVVVFVLLGPQFSTILQF